MTQSPGTSLGNLGQARSFRLPLRGRVTAASPDLLRFDLAASQRLSLRARSSAAGTRLAIGQDRNQNGLAEPSEILRRVGLSAKRTRSVELEDLSGTVFVQVTKTGQGQSRYQLRLAASQNSESQPVSQTTALAPSAAVAEQILQLTNAFRQQNGLPPLRLNSRLTSAAQLHAQNMALQDFVSHTGSDGSDIGDRISATGYGWSLAAENIAAGYSTAAAAVQGWIDSPGHRANLLNPQLSDLGVGYYFLASDPGQETWRFYWTQAFGAPA